MALPGNKNVHNFSGKKGEARELIFAPFDKTEQPTISLNLSVHDPNKLFSFELSERPEEPVISKANYISSVETAINSFDPGHFSKVVLARNEVIKKPKDFDPFNLFERLCKHHPHAFRYLLWHPLTGMWIGASPELLLEVNGRELKTMSLAGTIYGQNKEWTEKEYTEHNIVTEYIKDQLRSVDVSDMWVSETQTVSAGSIKHLQTNILAQMANTRTEDLVVKLHPTPAIAGFPTEEALDFLNKNEKLKRSYFAGYVGLRGESSARLFVNLRCMRVYRNELEFYAGAGITIDSDPESEWEETERKIATIKDLIQ